HDEVFFAVELDLGARVLPEENGVADLDVERGQLAVVVHLALADGDHLALLGLLLGGAGDDDAPLRLLHLLLEPLHEDAVLEWSDLHHAAPFLPLGTPVVADGRRAQPDRPAPRRFSGAAT